MSRYGLSVDDYAALLEGQGGVCAICGLDCSTGQRMSVDHDHANGEVRGLLCRRCNAGLGNFNDDPALMRTAIGYLVREEMLV